MVGKDKIRKERKKGGRLKNSRNMSIVLCVSYV